MKDGDFVLALEHATNILTDDTAGLDWTMGRIEVSNVAATCLVMTGRPHDALDTVAWLEGLETPYYDGSEIRAIAHLRLGDIDAAIDHIHPHAVRAATGRLPHESDESVALLAGLARAEGDDELARELLMCVGLGRQPSTGSYAISLARELGIADEVAAHRVQMAYEVAGPASVSRVALRAELDRRGWS